MSHTILETGSLVWPCPTGWGDASALRPSPFTLGRHLPHLFPVPITEAGKALLREQEANQSHSPRQERERTRNGTKLNVLKAPHAVTTSFCTAPPPTGSTASPNNATDSGPSVKFNLEKMFLIQTTTLSLMILLVLKCCLFQEKKCH